MRIFYLLLALTILPVIAQDCGDNFAAIDSECISAYEKNFKPLILNLKNINSNDVYFFKTDTGANGKIIFKFKEVQNHSCSVYYESFNFSLKGIHSAQETLSITNKLGIWGAREVNLDLNGGMNDFRLVRKTSSGSSQDGACLIEPLGVSWIKYRKLTKKSDESLIDYFAAIILFALAAFMISRSFFEEEDRFKAEEKIEDGAIGEDSVVKLDFVLKYSRPFFKRYFSPVVASMKNKSKIRDRYKWPIASAGLQKIITPDDFYAFKFFLILGFPVVFIFLRWFLEEDWSLIYIPLVSLLGFFYPDIWIKGKIQRRQEEVIQNMPFIVDMLALSVEAGLDFIAAMARVVEKAPKSALSEEFNILIKEIKIGSSRAEALRQLSWRVNLLSLSSFCATLIAADSVGTPIGPILKKLSQELREKRSSIAEKKGATAATKLLLPMIFFVLPAVILVIFAPMLFQFMGGGS